jgi:hypothetical protein
LQRLKLEVDGDNGHVVPSGLGEAEQVAAVVAVTGGEIDEQEAAGFIGQLVEDGFDGLLAAKGAIEPSEMLEIVAQGLFVLIRQIHQLGLGFGEFTLHPCENAHSCACVTVFFAKNGDLVSIPVALFENRVSTLNRASISYRCIDERWRLSRP